MAYVVKVVEPQAADAETTVGDAFGVSWDDRLNEVGFGTVSMPSDDTAAVKARVPLNEVRIYEADGTTLRWAFVIEQIDTTVVGSEEGGSKVLTVSGPGMGLRLSRAIVYPEYGLERPFGQTRLFGFMTPDMNGPNEGAVTVTSYGTQANPDTEIAGSLAGFPEGWPDPSAEWLTSSALVGTGTAGDPYRFDSGDLDGNGNPDGSGTFYLRREFTTTEDFGRCRIFAALDSYGTVFFDGVPVIDTLDPTNYTSGLTADVDIPAGAHCIAIRVTNRPALNDDANNFALALLTILQLDGDGLNPNDVLFRTFASPTTAGWQAFDPPTVPGLNAGQVMNILLAESDARSVGTVDAVDYDETVAANGDEVSATDTAGDSWTTTVNNFGWTIGTDYLTVLQGLQDLCGIDWYVSPDRTLSMWQNGRGTDRGLTPDAGATTVELTVGDDLLAYTVETDALRANSLLVRSQQGVSEQASVQGIAARVESLLDLGTVGLGTTEAGAAIDSTFTLSAQPQVIGRATVHGASGTEPYVNFDVGDIVSAPNDAGTQVAFRVKSVSVSQYDANGTPLYEVELRRPTSAAPFQVAVVIDTSTSMETNDPTDLRVAGAKSFVAQMRNTDAASVVLLNSPSTVELAMTDLSSTSDRTTVSTALDAGAAASGNTDIGSAATAAVGTLTGGQTTKVVLLLTDGRDTGSTAAATVASTINGASATCYTIGLGDQVETVYLTTVAEDTGGAYLFAATAADIAAVYDQIVTDLLAGG